MSIVSQANVLRATALLAMPMRIEALVLTDNHYEQWSDKFLKELSKAVGASLAGEWSVQGGRGREAVEHKFTIASDGQGPGPGREASMTFLESKGGYVLYSVRGRDGRNSEPLLFGDKTATVSGREVIRILADFLNGGKQSDR